MGLKLDSFLDVWDDVRRVVADRYFRVQDRVSNRVRSIRDVNLESNGAADSEVLEIVEPPESRVPEGVTVYAVGDIHGRADLLKKLQVMIMNDAEKQTDPNHRHAIVFLGDYVDRGFQSREVIDLLTADFCPGFEARFLKGNHEEALLAFLMDCSKGPRWAEYGGVETLISYGVQPPRSRERLDDWEQARLELTERMPSEHRYFLEQLELCLVLGDYAFVHAGLRPGKSLEEQTEKDILWIRDDFLNDERPFENIVVHGHSPINIPHRDFRRIGVDTGAYMSGRLTAVRLSGDDVSFIMTG